MSKGVSLVLQEKMASPSHLSRGVSDLIQFTVGYITDKPLSTVMSVQRNFTV
jgi:hypothetical protein